MTLSRSDFITRAIAKHGDHYDYSFVEYKNTKLKVKIQCAKHGIFEQTPEKHMSGHGCPICNAGIKFNTEIFKLKAQEIHGNWYDYNMVNYINSSKNVSIICSLHGVFEQLPSAHLQGSGCPHCGTVLVRQKTSKNIDRFIEDAREKHGYRYDYSLVNYVNNKTKVQIVCRLHGVFEQTPANHVCHSKGCPRCVGHNKTTEDYINEANIIHEFKYDYTLVEYTTAKTKVKIICPLHGTFVQSPDKHLQGHGCPKCSEPKLERKWLKSLDIDGIIHQYKVFFDGGYFCVDGYDPKTKTCYEFNGDYWHGNPKIYLPCQYNERTKCLHGEMYMKTVYKQHTLENLGYRVVSMWEADFKQMLKRRTTYQQYV